MPQTNLLKSKAISKSELNGMLNQIALARSLGKSVGEGPFNWQKTRELVEESGVLMGSKIAAAKIVSLMMCKGGVGKSTLTHLLAQRISQMGFRVLLIDADPQGNLTATFELENKGFEMNESTPVLMDLLSRRATFEEARISLCDGLDLIPSTPVNSMLDVVIREHYRNPAAPIRELLKNLKSDYEFIFVDTAPSLNLINTAVMVASDLLILPVMADRFSEIGANISLKEKEQIENEFSVSLAARVLLNKWDAREKSAGYYEKYYSQARFQRFETIIKSTSEYKNIFLDKDLGAKSRVARKNREDFDGLVAELIGHFAVSRPQISQELKSYVPKEIVTP
ncbi:MAG: hypothetical protein COT74_06235 [Bdellovibrionales bacterium CG10_big_fil_rev_8_21_14_0_10_45_34]|nr:MAG: hypothetical protein COT74_06235 [Bdellovibrionales bacterium CG10_big_fil_rev_8_21_14_0_10_45_34]